MISERNNLAATHHHSHIIGLLGLLALCLLLLPGTSLARGSTSGYELGPGDMIRVQVFGEEDLSVETRVSDSNSMSYPFLGEINLRGLTATGLEDLITRRLKGPYLIDPEVTVSILEYRPFYVNGEVEDPGGFPFTPGLTVRKAISLAGGFKERANRSRITVVRDDDPGGDTKPIEISAPVSPGDIITVERSFF